MSYDPTIWKSGDVVTSAKLNKIEKGIEDAGSGGGGGGAFVCTLNMQTMALDKTWQEIHDAVFSVIVIHITEDSISRIVVSGTESVEGQFLVTGYTGNTAYQWKATSADGYPVLQQA